MKLKTYPKLSAIHIAKALTEAKGVQTVMNDLWERIDGLDQMGIDIDPDTDLCFEDARIPIAGTVLSLEAELAKR